MQRLAFGSQSELETWIEEMLSAAWAISRPVDIARVAVSGPNALAFLSHDGEDLVVKWSTRRDMHHLDCAALAVHHLADAGIPVSLPRRTGSGCLASIEGSRRVELHSHTPGAHLDPTDPTQLSVAGRGLAELHAQLQGLEHNLVAEFSSAQTSFDPCGDLLSIADLSRLSDDDRSLWNSVLELAQGAGDRPPVQLIHYDYRAANLLFDADSGSLTVLDFEDMRIGPRVADLARACALLGTQYRDWAPLTVEMCLTFIDEYQKVFPLTRSDKRWLRPLLVSQLLAAASAGWGKDPWHHAATEVLGNLFDLSEI